MEDFEILFQRAGKGIWTYFVRVIFSMVNSLGFAYKRILFCNFYFSVRIRT